MDVDLKKLTDLKNPFQLLNQNRLKLLYEHYRESIKRKLKIIKAKSLKSFQIKVNHF